MASFRVNVEPEVLKWARTSARIDEVHASKRVGVPVDRLQAWERGDSAPTFYQLKSLAELYRRPLAVMYLPDPPKDWDAMREKYRRVLEDNGVEIPVTLVHALNRVRMQQDVMLEIYEDEEFPKPTFDVDVDPTRDIEVTSAELRRWLGLRIQDQRKWSMAGSLVPNLTRLIEAREILVTQVQSVSVDAMRACSLSDHPIPAILLNGADSPTAKAFSLMHELIHILLWKSGYDTVAPVTTHLGWTTSDSSLERFCNRVAGQALAPTELLRQLPLVLEKSPSNWTIADLQEAARGLGFSPQAIMLRFVALKIASWDDYHRMAPILEARTGDESIREANTELPIYYPLRVRDYGRRYIRFVADAYDRSLFSTASVTEYLGVKIEKLSKLRSAAMT